MAQKRMFSLKVIDTDLFIEMPQSTRLLYYELCMRADDDGFVASPNKIRKITGCSEDDYKILMAKQYIIPFESGVCVIKHWRIHNLIRADRYNETEYRLEKSALIDDNGKYEIGTQNVIPIGNQMDTQVRLGKVSKGKVRLDKDILPSQKLKFTDEHMEIAELLLSLIKDNNPNYVFRGSINEWADQIRLMVERDNIDIGLIKRTVNWCQQDTFWQANILSTKKLREKFNQLTAKMQQPKKQSYGGNNQMDMIKNVLSKYDEI